MIRAGVLHELKGGTEWSPLFVFCAALLLLAASLLEGNAYRWAAIALLLLGFVSAPSRSLPANLLSLAVGLYCAWLFVNAAFLTPTYTAEGLYRPLILFGGFVAAAALGRDAHETLFRAGAALLGVLVLIGLLQFFFGFWHLEINPQRAAATFITPNTFATAINLFLLPLTALAVTGRAGWRAFAAMLWLFAGLLATESRGGWIAFVAGLGFIAIYIDLPRARQAWAPCKRVLAGLLWVIIAFWVATRIEPAATLSALFGTTTDAFWTTTDAFGTTILSRGSSFRTEIYAVALDLIAERPLAGHGANMFWPLYEMTKPAQLDVPSTYLFVHNDYLQIWLEFGLPGLALLVMVIGSALALIRAARRDQPGDPLPLACGAAASGLFVHALVDFPLHIPFLLVAIGVWIGALAVHAGDSRRLGPVLARAGVRLRSLCTPLIAGTLAAAALAWLAQPVLADLAERKAIAELRAGEADAGLYWQSVARRLESRDATRHWAEGIIWRDQAVESGSKGFAARADALFADSIAANPNEIGFYMERARLHRNHADLLERPASAAQILVWTGQAVKLRPYSLRARVDHARSLAYAGRNDEAKRLANSLLDRHPGSDAVLRLASDLKL